MRLIIDVGGTKTLIVAVDGGGNEISRQRFPTDEKYPNFESHLKDEIDIVIESSDQPLEGIAIAMPGLVNYTTKTVLGFGNLDWKDIKIYDFLKDNYSVPVVIDNDANFGAIGEARRGAGKGYRVVLYVTISTGIGTGIAINGKIDPVLAHSEAGSMHFWDSGKYVQWEKVASGKAFLEKYGKMGHEVPGTDKKIWREYAKQLAIGLEALISIIQPDVIVVGGSMGEHLPKYLEYIEATLKSFKSATTKLPPILQAREFDGAVISGGIEAMSDVI